MTTRMRRAWRHVKYTSSDLRSARERAERDNAMAREAQERRRELEHEWERLAAGGVRPRYSPLFSSPAYGSDTIVDPDSATPKHPRWKDQDSYSGMWKGRYVVGVACFILLSAIFGLIFGIRGLAHNIDHRECPRKAAAMGVQAQWVDYSWFGWECLANVDGRWVPIDTVHNDTGVWIRGNGGQ